MLSHRKMSILVATFTALALLTTSCGRAVETTPTSGGLRIVLKDPGMPEVKFLQPTIKEVQLQRQDGSWITIWNDPNGKTVNLTPDGAEVILETVSLEAGTYVGSRLLVSEIYVEVDVNRDGDTLDTNVELVLTEEEFQRLPRKEKPETTGVAPTPPTKPTPPPPPAPTNNISSNMTLVVPPPREITTDNISSNTTSTARTPPPPPTEPTKPPEPPKPPEPEPPYKIVEGLVYTGKYLDETHTATPKEGYLIPLWETDFVYEGKGGKIIFDFTLYPLEPKGQQISVKVSTVTPALR